MRTWWFLIALPGAAASRTSSTTVGTFSHPSAARARRGLNLRTGAGSHEARDDSHGELTPERAACRRRSRWTKASIPHPHLPLRRPDAPPVRSTIEHPVHATPSQPRSRMQRGWSAMWSAERRAHRRSPPRAAAGRAAAVCVRRLPPQGPLPRKRCAREPEWGPPAQRARACD